MKKSSEGRQINKSFKFTPPSPKTVKKVVIVGGLLIIAMVIFYRPGVYRTSSHVRTDQIIEHALTKNDVSVCNKIKPGLTLFIPGAFLDGGISGARRSCVEAFAISRKECELCKELRFGDEQLRENQVARCSSTCDRVLQR